MTTNPDPDVDTVELPVDDLEPDPEPNEVPTAIVEQDENAGTPGVGLQTILFGIGIALLIFLVLFLASGRSINFLWLFKGDEQQNAPRATLVPRLDSVGGSSAGSGITVNSTNRFYGVDGLGTLPPYASEIHNEFLGFWMKNGGERIFGRPISGLLEENGRKFQWFERARLELWPEHLGTKYEVQSGRVGVEFTKNRDFPPQEFFANRSGMQYFPETQHGLRGAFYEFWQNNGGVDILGYPISEELQEVLPEDGTYHTVQYFERARLELHPNDPNQNVKVGLLGTYLYKQASEPNYIDPLKPTIVPVTP